MSVSAPPRPPSIEDPPDLDALEALIEEARQRARRRRQQRNTAVVLAALLVGFAAYVGFARGGSQGATSAGSAALPAQGAREAGAVSMRFRLLSTPTGFRLVDREPKGVESKGDVLYVKAVLRNWSAQFHRPENAVVGSDSWVLTALASPGWSLVKATVKLPGGTLRLQGRAHVSSYVRFVPVVGGTGRFANARGTVRVQERASLPSLNDYRLRLP
jgi:Dirigent-like protein